MKIGGSCASIARTCIGEVCVRRTTSSGPGRQALDAFEARLGSSVGRVDVEGVLRHPRRVARAGG